MLQTQIFSTKTIHTHITEGANPDKKSNFRPGPFNLKRKAHTSLFSFRDFETKLKKV
jgi:hypothetical protein